MIQRCGIIAGGRRRLGGGADPVDLAETLAWLEMDRDVVEAAPYALTAGSVGLGMDSDYELAVTASSSISLVVGETVNVAFSSSATFPGDDPATLDWTVKSGSGTSWVLSVPDTRDLDDWIGEALGAGTLTPAVPRIGEGGITANGWSGVFESPTVARQLRIVQDGGAPALEANDIGDMVLSNPGDVNAEEGYTIGQVIALTGANDAVDRSMTLVAGGMLIRLFINSGSWFAGTGTAQNIGSAAADSVYRWVQVHVRRTSAGQFTYRARVGDGALQTGSITMNSDETGDVAVSAFWALSANIRQLNNAHLRLQYAMSGDQVDNETVLAYIAAKYPDAEIPSI